MSQKTRKNLILSSNNHESIVTRESDHFYFRDNYGNAEIVIAARNIPKLIEFLTEGKTNG